MDKPISVAMRELKENIVFQMQESQLYPVIIESVLKDILYMVQADAERQYQIESQKYNEYLSGEMESNDNQEEVTE